MCSEDGLEYTMDMGYKKGEKTYGGIVVMVILKNLLDCLRNVWLIVLLKSKC